MANCNCIAIQSGLLFFFFLFASFSQEKKGSTFPDTNILRLIIKNKMYFKNNQMRFFTLLILKNNWHYCMMPRYRSTDYKHQQRQVIGHWKYEKAGREKRVQCSLIKCMMQHLFQKGLYTTAHHAGKLTRCQSCQQVPSWISARCYAKVKPNPFSITKDIILSGFL